MVNGASQLVDRAAVERHLAEVGQPAVGALGQLAEYASSRTLRHAESFAQTHEVGAAEVTSCCPPIDKALVVSPYTCEQGTS